MNIRSVREPASQGIKKKSVPVDRGWLPGLRSTKMPRNRSIIRVVVESGES